MGIFKKEWERFKEKGRRRQEIKEIERAAAYEERKKQAVEVGRGRVQLRAQSILAGERSRLGLVSRPSYPSRATRSKKRKEQNKKVKRYVNKKAYKPNLKPRKQDQDVIDYIMKM